MSVGTPSVVGFSFARLGSLRRFRVGGPGILFLTFVFVIVSAILRYLLTVNLYPDDAELTAFARELHGGYSDQPPLYAWMLWAVFRITGLGLAGLSIVRAALLTALVGLTYLTARRFVPDRRLVGVLAFSALLQPSYGWHATTYLTHSLLLGVAVMGMVYAVARVVRGGTLFDFVLLGVAVGVGGMAKYNFALVVFAAVAAGSTVPAIRPRLWNARLFIAAAVALLILLPHLLWLVGHWEDVLLQVRNKANRAESPPYWDGVLQGLEAAVVCLTSCVALVVPLLAWLGRGAHRLEPADPVIVWAGRFLVALFVIHISLVFTAGVTRFQDRWVQPLLLPLPLWYLARFAPETISAGRVRVLKATTAFLAAAILAAQVGQIVFAQSLPGRYDLRLDYERLARDLEAAGYGHATVISLDREITGNLCVYLPNANLRYLSGVEAFVPPPGTSVLWDARRGSQPPSSLAPDFHDHPQRAIRVQVFTLHSFSAPSRSVTVMVYALPKRR